MLRVDAKYLLIGGGEREREQEEADEQTAQAHNILSQAADGEPASP